MTDVELNHRACIGLRLILPIHNPNIPIARRWTITAARKGIVTADIRFHLVQNRAKWRIRHDDGHTGQFRLALVVIAHGTLDVGVARMSACDDRRLERKLRRLRWRNPGRLRWIRRWNLGRLWRRFFSWDDWLWRWRLFGWF